MRSTQTPQARRLAAALVALMVFVLPAAGCRAGDATPATLGLVLAASKPGATLRLKGDFGVATISGKWATPITLDASGATFRSLRIRNASGIILRGGTWKLEEPDWAGSIMVTGSDHISIHDSVIDNAGTSSGISFRDSTDVLLQGARIDRTKVAVSLLHVTRATIRDTTMMRVAIDGMDIASSHQVLAQNNACLGNRLVDDHHPDCIQMWSIQGETPTSDITLRDNLAFGGTQGFTGFSRTGGGFDRIIIDGNVAVITYPNGVALMSGRQSRISNNRLSTLPGSKYRTHVYLVDSPDTVVCGNTAAAHEQWPATQDPPCPN